MKLLLDTHFLLWTTLRSKKLERYRWLDGYRPWGVSPISLLEIQFLAEIGRLEVEQPHFTNALLEDHRFVVDEVPLVALIQRALPLTWTRDPFDRLLAAHSSARRVPLCTVDRSIVSNHRLIPEELV